MQLVCRKVEGLYTMFKSLQEEQCLFHCGLDVKSLDCGPGSDPRYLLPPTVASARCFGPQETAGIKCKTLQGHLKNSDTNIFVSLQFSLKLITGTVNVPFIHVHFLPVSVSWLINCWLLSENLLKPLSDGFSCCCFSGVSAKSP